MKQIKCKIQNVYMLVKPVNIVYKYFIQVKLRWVAMLAACLLE